MTEAEWLVCTDPQKMLNILEGKVSERKFWRRKASDRKLRLFACACCRSIWHLLTDARSRKAIELAEQSADGLTNPQALLEASESAWAAANEMIRLFWPTSGTGPYNDPDFLDGMPDDRLAHPAACDAACAAAEALMNDLSTVPAVADYACHAKAQAAAPVGAESASAVGIAARDEAERTEWAAQATLLRDIFGLIPFRPVAMARAWKGWNDGIIPKLAQAIYDERAFDRMPILGDALEEAGCTDQDILAHCRSGGEHVRGCWVVDLVLGKE
jgi:hypothetical protein